MTTSRALFIALILASACGAPSQQQDAGSLDAGFSGGGGGGGASRYAVGGSVKGLTGTGLVLKNKSGNSEDELSVTSSGQFVFPNTLTSGSTYLVAVKVQPSNQECSVSGGAGVMGSADVTTVEVTCGPANGLFTIGGQVTGLVGMVELANNGEKLLVATDGAFFFPTAVATGTAYSVSVSTQPDTVSCVVSNGAGTVNGASVTDIQVTCAAGLADKVMVVRVGTGTGSLSNAATAVFLDEYQLSDGAHVRTIPVTGLTLSGTATSEGSLSRSVNQKYLTLAGYSASVGTSSVAGTMSAATPRIAGRIDAAGTVDVSTQLSAAFDGESVRGATSADGTAFWVSGNGNGTSAGIHYVTMGSTGASTQVLATPNNTRWAGIFDNQLYVSASSGTSQGVLQVGTGLPTTAGALGAQLPGLPMASFPAYGYALFDLDPATPGVDTAYLAVDALPSAGKVNVQKWVLNNGTWSQQTTFVPATPAGATFTAGARGLTATKTNGGVLVVATTAEAIPRLVSFVDDLSNPSPELKVVATSATNTAFRGVAFSPVP